MCPSTYESGSRFRLGELDSGASLGYILPLSDTPHTDESDSLEPESSRTRTCMGTLSVSEEPAALVFFALQLR
jgi:hypothetical protein